MAVPIPPPFGIYPPVVTFFNEDETVDYNAFSKHLGRLLDGGVTGLVIHGSNGEASHLLHEERAEMIRAARRIADQRKKSTVIIAGCSAPSVRETLLFIEEAKQAGADYALVLPPSFWPAVMTKPVIRSFYIDVRIYSPNYTFRAITADNIHLIGRCKVTTSDYNLQLPRCKRRPRPRFRSYHRHRNFIPKHCRREAQLRKCRKSSKTILIFRPRQIRSLRRKGRLSSSRPHCRIAWRNRGSSKSYPQGSFEGDQSL